MRRIILTNRVNIEKFKKFCVIDKHMDLLQEQVEVTGFQLYVIEDWFLSGRKFYCTFLVPTGNDEDKVNTITISTFR